VNLFTFLVDLPEKIRRMEDTLESLRATTAFLESWQGTLSSRLDTIEKNETIKEQIEEYLNDLAPEIVRDELDSALEGDDFTRSIEEAVVEYLNDTEITAKITVVQ